MRFGIYLRIVESVALLEVSRKQLNCVIVSFNSLKLNRNLLLFHAQFDLDMLSHKVTGAASTLLVMLTLSWTTVDSRPRIDNRVELHDLWVEYKKTHSKTYADDIEESYR